MPEPVKDKDKDPIVAGTIQPKATPPPPPVETPPPTTDRSSAAIGFGIMFVVFYAIVVWPRLPGLAWKLGVSGGVVVLVALGGWLFWKTVAEDTFDALRAARNWFVVLCVIFASAFSCVYFAAREQGLLLQIFAITYLSFLPPWLYLQFMSTRGRTLWDEYVLHLHRLDIDRPIALPAPPVRSVHRAGWDEAVKAAGDQAPKEPSLYQKKFENLYGLWGSSPGRDRFFPVAVTTIVSAVAWTFILGPGTVFGVGFLGAKAIARTIPIDLGMLRFGLMGAYFYSLQLLVRRYFQNDLKTGAYLNILSRMIVVALLVWVARFVLPDDLSEPTRAAVAFLIGVFPDLGLQLIQAAVKKSLGWAVPSLRSKYPLSDLDGLNVWYEARLLEEGIEDMQNLATANIVDLMLNTRIPVERLIDWIDQALLYLHLPRGDEEAGPRAKLREYGLRTATDLIDARDVAQDKLAEVDAILDAPGQKGPSRLTLIAAALLSEPNLRHVKAWRGFDNAS